MEPVELIYFEELKREINAVFRKNHPNCKSEMAEWKGQDIVDFQEELMNKVHGRLSEKWFYTYIKSPITKLPRIDMLNMLSKYAGYKNWNDFIGTKHGGVEIRKNDSSQIETNEIIPVSNPPFTVKFKTAFIFFFIVCILLIVLFAFFYPQRYTYRCCFVDMDENTPIKSNIRIILLKENESPLSVESDLNGCIKLEDQPEKIKFVINTPYFQPDTFIRNLNVDCAEERIRLRVDDYALMIHYFSKSNIKDWERRRQQLNDMIADNARILQIYGNKDGMELYNKQEFINKITMPLKSIRNIEILSVKYADKKISELRFIQTSLL